jgi:3D-(3,5/4)-trihydroxycyclohexane-1,2-dione acylhydrolase (decyclizing)
MNHTHDVERLTVAQATVRYLATQWSERDGRRERLIAGMHGIFGHGNVTGLGQALAQERGLTYYQGRHEQGMVHAAIGYARAMRRRSTMACTASIGPGSTNMLTGAATATVNHLPVLLLPADYFGNRRGGNVLQQLEHPIEADTSVNDCFRPVSRFFDRVLRPEQLLTALPEAMRVLTDPAMTGAVTVALPQDVATEAFDVPRAFLEPHVWPIRRALPIPDEIATVVAALGQARQPALIAGGGVIYSEAEAALAALAESLGIPVAETFAGKGAMREASELLLGGLGVEGNPAANEVVGEADLVLCVGTRLGDFVTASRSLFRHPEVRFVGINVNGHDAAKLGALGLVADAREALRAILEAGREAGLRPDPEYVQSVRRRRGTWLAELAADVSAGGTPMSQGQVIRVMQESAGAGDLIVAAAGAPPGDLLKQWDATAGRGAHIEFGYSCMGHEIPAALGARMALGPSGEVIAFVGDGTFLLNPTDIVTAVQERQKLTVVVADNHGFQVIRRLQLWRVGQTFGTEFRARSADGRLDGDYLPLDLAGLAEALGARGWHCADEDGLREALREARDHAGVSVVVAEIEKQRFLPASEAWWDAPSPEISDDPETRQRRAEYEAGREGQRYFG